MFGKYSESRYTVIELVERNVALKTGARKSTQAGHQTVINVLKKKPMIGKYIGFLYLDKNGMPMVALHWQKYFDHICTKYNSIYKVQMSKITPHVCKHT